MMTGKEIMDTAEQYVLHTYNRYPLAIAAGEGVRLYDEDGKAYLDFMSGIGVHALGYHFPGYDEALIAQIKKVTHTSNLYYHAPLAEAAKKLAESAGLSKVFFTNSGAEAIEGAIKAARKYSFTAYGPERYEIVSMYESFHGRTAGALSVTGNDHYQEAFRPLLGGICFAKYNDLSSLEAALTEKTCAVILETVQGEGGIFPADPAYLAAVRKICDERDIVLILDEVQCGMGRTGDMWAYEAYGVKPDILCTAKALGCGVPVGAFAVNEKLAASSLVPGDHGTTYGGNPFAAAAVSAVFDLYAAGDICGRAKKAGEILASRLDELKAQFPFILEHRGRGLMRGLELDESVSAGAVTTSALKEGLLIITAGHNVLRFLPPLVISEEEIIEGTGILEKCLRAIR